MLHAYGDHLESSMASLSLGKLLLCRGNYFVYLCILLFQRLGNLTGETQYTGSAYRPQECNARHKDSTHIGYQAPVAHLLGGLHGICPCTPELNSGLLCKSSNALEDLGTNITCRS